MILRSQVSIISGDILQELLEADFVIGVFAINVCEYQLQKTETGSVSVSASVSVSVSASVSASVLYGQSMMK